MRKFHSEVDSANHLSCVHTKSKFNLWRDEITYKVNGMMQNSIRHCNRAIVRWGGCKLMHNRGDICVHREFKIFSFSDWSRDDNHEITRFKYFFRFWCVHSFSVQVYICKVKKNPKSFLVTVLPITSLEPSYFTAQNKAGRVQVISLCIIVIIADKSLRGKRNKRSQTSTVFPLQGVI